MANIELQIPRSIFDLTKKCPVNCPIESITLFDFSDVLPSVIPQQVTK